MQKHFKHDDYRPLNKLKYLLIVVLTLATAGTVVLSMIGAPGGSPLPSRGPAPDAPRCLAGQTTDCVGGTVSVIALPASAAPAKAP
jgi:hypothetical protein